MKDVKLVIVDDHPVVLQGLKHMMNEADGIEVVGQANSGDEALDKIPKWKPDVVLMDVRLPGMNGLEVMRRLKEQMRDLHIILITVSDSDLYLVEALRWGASGYLSKDSSKELISHAVKAAVQGGTTLAQPLVDKGFGAIARSAVNLGKPKDDESLPSLVELTPRELDVLRLVSEGKTNRTIAGELSLAEVTVKKHVQSILSKLGVRDRTQAALRGVRLALID
ncbi:MAG: response regulator [Vulcanimicrobiota bacterium]